MWLLPVPREIVHMLMMLVVRVLMAVHLAFVGVLVSMQLAQVQPDTQAHQHRCHPEWRRRGFAEQQDTQSRANEGRGGEISPGARGAQIAQGAHKEDQTQAIAQ